MFSFSTDLHEYFLKIFAVAAKLDLNPLFHNSNSMDKDLLSLIRV